MHQMRIKGPTDKTCASRERYSHAIKKNQFYSKSVCHDTQDVCAKRKSRQNQIKSDFITCRVRIAWKSYEYDVGSKVFPNAVTIPTIRKNAIIF